MYQQGDWERPVDGIDQQHKEWRTPFKRDYGRVVHSASFRRLQGKTQVFPGRESDFFRNRLTHSLEVAQIAEGVADRLNEVYVAQLHKGLIDGRLCATAGLIHDIGHPPFGHNGERALDAKMRPYGGFEGNAQTLRIVARLEKKVLYDEPVSGDCRAGMNLCYRTLAAVLKYDREIPSERATEDKFVKGYYGSESEIVAKIKTKVLNGLKLADGEKFRTIECGIMDLADDIAYSVYDLEDSLKVGFLSPATILSTDDKLLSAVAEAVSRECDSPCDKATVLSVLVDIFGGIVKNAGNASDNPVIAFTKAVQSSNALASDAYIRTRLSSQLVHEFINGVRLEYDVLRPMLSKVVFTDEIKLKVEVLKQYTYQATIYSHRVKLGEYRGTEIVTDIFNALEAPRGSLLMPDDVRSRYEDASDKATKARTICDFVAGMTDRYAMEFWARLRSDTAESMFKPI